MKCSGDHTFQLGSEKCVLCGESIYNLLKKTVKKEETKSNQELKNVANQVEYIEL